MCVCVYVCMKYYSIIVYDNNGYYKINDDDDDVLCIIIITGYISGKAATGQVITKTFY